LKRLGRVLEVEELIDHRSGDNVYRKESVLKAGGEVVMGNGNVK
jgi:hypothetical protein